MESTANALPEVQASGGQDFTDLLQAWRGGDQHAMGELMTRVYDELRRLAGHYMRGERSDHTLQPTALIHEAWLRLTEQRQLDWHSRAHFVAMASTMMRRVLLNHARDRRAAKRCGEAQGAAMVSLESCGEIASYRPTEIVAIDEALRSLARREPRLGTVVELRLFGGFTVTEAARYLGLSTATLKRDWRLARAWIRREMKL